MILRLIWGVLALSSLAVPASRAAELPTDPSPLPIQQIREQIEADQSAFWQAYTEDEQPTRHLYRGYNLSQDYGLELTAERVAVVARSERKLTFALREWGYDGSLSAVEPPRIAARGARVDYHRGAITEWYVNGASGLEQGFTIAHPPAGQEKHRAGPLRLVMSLEPGLEYRLEDHDRSLVISAPDGSELFRYHGLKAWDSDERPLSAKLELSSGERLAIVVDDSNAVYPVMVDPIVSNIDHTFRGPYSSRNNEFGISVAIDGDTAAVGASRDERINRFHGTGAVYIFIRNLGGTNNWGLQRKVAPPDLRPGDRFGAAVALDGDLLVVGAPGADGSDGATIDAGSLLYFSRDEGGTGNWGLVRSVENVFPGGRLGEAVAINPTGDTVVAGEPGSPFNGSVHIYEKDEGGTDNWGEVKLLNTPASLFNNSGLPTEFGTALAIDADSLVVGVPLAKHPLTGVTQGVAVLYEEDQGGTDNWGEVITLIPQPPLNLTEDKFGQSVSIAGDSIAVGFPGDDDVSIPALDHGSVYIFDRDQGGAGTWNGGNPRKILTSAGTPAGDQFGQAVSIKLNSLLVGAPGAGDGTVYQYGRDTGGADNWGLANTFVPSDGAAGMGYGSAIARQGGTTLIGAPEGDDGSGANAGAAYVLDNLTGSIAERTRVDGNVEGDRFTEYARAVSRDGTTIAIGARGDGGTGAVYVYYKDEGGTDNWGEVVRLVGSDSTSGDQFGYDVSLDGDLLAVSALLDLNSTTAGSTVGSVYIFARDHNGVADSWGEEKKITYTDVSVGVRYGESIGLSGDTLVVGRTEDGSLGSQHGSAYVYQRDTGGAKQWGQVKKLLSSDLSDFDRFGMAVTIDGDIIAVGAPREDQLNGAGAAYLFYRDQGGTDNWGEVRRVLPSNGAAFDQFGYAVSLSGSTLVVGGPFHAGEGNAYVYERDLGGADNWGEAAILESDFTIPGLFGFSVSIDGDLALVGEPSSVSGAGFFKLFARNRGGAGNWGGLDTGTFIDIGAPPDGGIGTDVEIDGLSLLIGGSGSSLYDASGFAYLRNLEMPPRVANVNTAADTGDGSLDQDEQVDVAVNSISVTFDQAMDPVEAEKSANFRLVNTGGNGSFESLALCSGGAPGGDDTEITESGIGYDATTFTVSFDVPGPLSAPSYTLLLCPDLFGEDGFLLDGDGDGNEGDVYTLDFTILDTDGDGDPDFSDPDDDNDGMDDTFEDAHAVTNSKDPSDAGEDPDGDGLTNLEEFEKDPLNLDPNDPDSDGDGIGDALDGDPAYSNACTIGTGQYTFSATPITETVICAADSIVLEPITVSPPNGHLILITLGEVTVTAPFSAGELTVRKVDPCPGCFP